MKRARKLAMQAVAGSSLLPAPVDVTVRMSRDSDYALAGSDVTIIPWTTEEFDTVGEFDLANPTRVTMRRTGRRKLSFKAEINTTDANVFWQLRRIDQGGNYTTIRRWSFANDVIQEDSVTYVFRAGEQLEASVDITGVSSRDLIFTSGSAPVLEITLLAKGGE